MMNLTLVTRSRTILFECFFREWDIAIHIPRSFTGILSVMESKDYIRFSDSVMEWMGCLSEADDSKKCFVRELPEFDVEWKGNEAMVRVESGSVTVEHVDSDTDWTPTVPPSHFVSI
jgi:hypothetical protein